MMMPPPLAGRPLPSMMLSVTCRLAVTPLGGANLIPMPGPPPLPTAFHRWMMQCSRTRAPPFWNSTPAKEPGDAPNEVTVTLRSVAVIPAPFTTTPQTEIGQSMVIDFWINMPEIELDEPASRQCTSPSDSVAAIAEPRSGQGAVNVHAVPLPVVDT